MPTTCFFKKCKNHSGKDLDRNFVPFVKPHSNLQRCKEWIQLCGRPNYPLKKITRNSYICDEHFNLNEVLDWKINPNLKPIPTYRLKNVDARDVFRIMCGSCHFDRVSDDEFSVKFFVLIF